MSRTPAGGNSTRDRLIRAGGRLFASRGVHGAQLRDVVRLAGQSNPSAVQYHFGSREGLLDALLRDRQERSERALREILTEPAGRPLDDLLAALVDSEARELRTERGRDALRISAQVGRHGGARPPEQLTLPQPTDDCRRRLIAELEVPLSDLPEPVRRERIDLAVTLIGTALAERARQLSDGEQPLIDEPLFLADLAAMARAMLTAPLPTTG